MVKIHKKSGKKGYKAAFAGLFSLLILLSLFAGGIGLAQENETSGSIVLVYAQTEEDMSLIERNEGEILERYENGVLISMDDKNLETLRNLGLEVNTLPKRTTIHVSGYEFDFTEGEPDIPRNLRVEDYGPGVKGQYIVHMIGPIASSWRPTLERMDVDVLHYMHNYAYRVRMTPEQAKEVSELYFVDWVGIYHPAYKIQPGLEPGIVEVMLLSESSEGSIISLLETTDVIFFADVATGEYYFKANVNSREKLHILANINDVNFLTEYAEPELLDEIQTQLIGGGCWFFDDEDDDPSTPYRNHGDYGSYMNQIGYEGEGIVIAIADSGIGARSHEPNHPDFQERLIGRYSYDGMLGDFVGHGTHCAGIAAGHTFGGTEETNPQGYYLGQGSAPGADLYDIKIFTKTAEHLDPDYIGPTDIYDILQKGSAGGAVVHSNSWFIGGVGTGTYGFYSSRYDKGVRDFGMVVPVAAGNTGPSYQTITQPATGKNVITVGASINDPGPGAENVWIYSSRGWTQDNRIKPDLIAPGEGVPSTWIDWEWHPSLEIPVSYEYGYSTHSGTSMAAPALAGASAVTIEWYEVNHGSSPSPAMVKALLINTANDLCNENGNTGPIPNRDEGWGIVDISKLERPLEDPVPFYLYDQEHIFTNSLQVHEHVVVPDRLGEPLKFSLVWTDKEAPSGTGNGRAIINDLNLEVETPSGEFIRGNAFDLSGNGQSDDGYTYSNAQVMGAFDYNNDGWDDTNNVENVYIHPDDVEIGNYIVRIKADNIAGDAVDLGYNSQDYALVVYNAANHTELPTVLNMRGHQHTVNNLEAFDLTNSPSYKLNHESSTLTHMDTSSWYTVNWGIRIFGRNRQGQEAELTFGTPEAIVSRSSPGSGYQSTSWSYWFPSTTFDEGDALVIRVYSCIYGQVPWTEQATFITTDLTEFLDGNTLYLTNWDIHYYTSYSRGFAFPSWYATMGTFHWGTIEHNSRVEFSNTGGGGPLTFHSNTEDTYDLVVEWNGHPESRYFEVRLNDGDLINVGTSTQHTFKNLTEGTYVLTVRMIDKGGRSWVETVEFRVGYGPP